MSSISAKLKCFILFFATELPLKLRSVAHFYTTVVNTNHTSRPPNGQCICVFVDKLKDMELAKTTAKAKEACRLTRFYTNMTRIVTSE